MKLVCCAAVVLMFACSSAAPPPPAPAPAPVPASPVKETSAAALVDHSGDSTETAVAVPKDAPNEGIDWVNNWIYDHYGRFRRKSWGLAQQQGRHYKVVTFELPDHSEHTAYFDITELWEAWTPPPAPPAPPTPPTPPPGY